MLQIEDLQVMLGNKEILPKRSISKEMVSAT